MEINKNDPQMVDFYNSLSPDIKNQLSKLQGNVSTVGELMIISQNLNLQLGGPDIVEQ